MKLNVGLCRHCTVGRENCQHYLNLHRQTKQIDSRGTLTHHCPVYYEVLKMGQRVEVELKEIKKYDGYYHGEPEAPYAEWVSAGNATGVIVEGNKIKGFYLVKLDKPVELCYPNNGDWLNAKEVEVTHTRRRLKDIEILIPAPKVPIKDESTLPKV